MTDRVYGPLKTSELRVAKQNTFNSPSSQPQKLNAADENQHIAQPEKIEEIPAETALPEQSFRPAQAKFMIVPLLTMVCSMFFFMYWSGQGDLTKGSGSKSVLYATCLALVVAYVLLLSAKKFKHQTLVNISFKGIGEMLPLVTIVILSLTLGASLKELGTGIYISGIVGDYLPSVLIVPMLFLAGAIISFSTGTSWGTFAILIPIGVPLIQTLGLPPSLVIAAILGGGIFGDHCSPISDTTCVSAIASGCDLLEHVKTQMPYALFGGFLTLFAYIMVSIIMI